MKSGNIVLVGMTGVGEFTVGKSLFGASGFDSVDLVNDWRQRK